jgi:PAS domain S-box-containing protein
VWQSLPLFAGLFAVAIGVTVAIGWAIGNGGLAELGLSVSAIQLSTAAAVASVGGATALVALRRARRWTVLLCGGVLVLAAVAVVDWAFGVSLGIQRLFPVSPVRTVVTDQVAAHTAVVLALLAGALLTLDSRQQRAHRVLVCATLASTLLSAIGYLYRASTPQAISTFTGMALPSLLILILLSCALVVIGIDRGLKLTLVHRGAAGQLTRRLLPAALIAPVLLGALALAGATGGAYDARNGFALFAWSMAVVFSLIVLGCTLVLRKREEAQGEAEAALREARSDIDRFFDVSLDAMIIAHASGYYARVNPALARMLGFSVEELLARPINDLVHPDDAELSKLRFAELVAGVGVGQRENRYRCKDGSYRWILWTATAADERGLVYANGKDVTERRTMEDRLRASEERALEASRLKSEFVASMSHELRTPMNGVIGMADLLRRTPLNSVQSRYVDALGASSEALLAVISDILDFSKIEAGHLDLDPTDFDLRRLVEEATLMLAGQAHAKGLEINHWVDDGLPLAVHGDRSRLRQVLLNLLSNAVKFTAAGEVTLRVTDSAGGRLNFSVADTGIGIDREQAADLFEAFAQADQSTTRQYGGTGLGLAISRRLVELMGGSIGAEPREQGGSVFWFSAVLPAACGPLSPVRSQADLEARRILVIDDNATNQTILEGYLRSWTAACESVDRPSAALELLDRAAREGNPFELVVLDFDMQQMNGVELLREIRARPALGALKVVILSSAPLERAQLEVIGIAAVLTKPVRQAAIHDAIADALTGRLPRLAPATEGRTQSDRGLLVLLAEDNEINRMLAEALLVELGLRSSVARDGREAVEMTASTDYAAVFMDCQMPGLDGFEATRQIRAAQRGRRVPIIAMTALSMPGDRERCLAAGMDDYISKPVRREALEEIVRRWVPVDARAAPATGATDGGTDALDALDEGAGVLDEVTIMRIRDTLTAEKCAALVAAFEVQQEQCVSDIGAAFARGDRGEVRRVAHKLKGSSATLGALRLRACCERLELGDEGDGILAHAQIGELRDAATRASSALRRRLSAPSADARDGTQNAVAPA